MLMSPFDSEPILFHKLVWKKEQLRVKFLGSVLLKSGLNNPDRLWFITSYHIQVALAIHGFAIRDFDYSHWNLVEPNPLLMQ
jgi:hypothetical protein